MTTRSRLTEDELRGVLRDALESCPPSTAGEFTRALEELGVEVRRHRVKKILEELLRAGECIAVERWVKRNGRRVRGAHYCLARNMNEELCGRRPPPPLCFYAERTCLSCAIPRLSRSSNRLSIN